MSIGEKSVGMMPMDEKTKKRLNEKAEEELKRVEDAKEFLRNIIRAYDKMKITPRSDIVVIYPIIKKARRSGIVVEEKVGSEFMRQQMRDNYHLVLDWDRSSEVAQRLELTVGGAIQVSDFPFRFTTPVPLEKKDSSLKGIELYATRAFEVIATIDGI